MNSLNLLYVRQPTKRFNALVWVTRTWSLHVQLHTSQILDWLMCLSPYQSESEQIGPIPFPFKQKKGRRSLCCTKINSYISVLSTNISLPLTFDNGVSLCLSIQLFDNVQRSDGFCNGLARPGSPGQKGQPSPCKKGAWKKQIHVPTGVAGIGFRAAFFFYGNANAKVTINRHEKGSRDGGWAV